MKTDDISVRPMVELQGWFGSLRRRLIVWREPRMAPWLTLAEQILMDEASERRDALRALDALQIGHNPTAETDALYARIREVLTAGFLLCLVFAHLFLLGDDFRRGKRVRRVARCRWEVVEV